ncbi:hypothetical protein HZB88_00690 [archaeon]|nr:hypothetical protein [archaeon]
MLYEMDIISTYKSGIDALTNKREYKGFIIVSLGYPFFSAESLETFVEKYFDAKNINIYSQWGLEYLDRFHIFIADYPLRHNLIAFAKMDEDTALKTVRVLGMYFKERCLNAIKDLPNARINITSYFDLLAGNRDFQKQLTIGKQFTETNKKFLQRCIDLTLAGTKNKLKIIKEHHGKREFTRALSIAKDYSIEQIFATLYLYALYPISISKYAIPPPIRDIYDERFPELFEKLRLGHKIGHIQCVLKDTKVYSEFYDDEYENGRPHSI